MPGPDTKTGIVFGVLLSGVMSFVFAGLMPLLAMGVSWDWLSTWATGFLLAWPMGFLLVSALRAPLMSLAMRLTGQTKE